MERNSGSGSCGAKAGDGLQLVQGSAGVAERAAGDHGIAEAEAFACFQGCAGRGNDGSDQQRGLVANPAGGVLVDRNRMERGGIQRLPGEAHGVVRLPRGPVRQEPAGQPCHSPTSRDGRVESPTPAHRFLRTAQRRSLPICCRRGAWSHYSPGSRFLSAERPDRAADPPRWSTRRCPRRSAPGPEGGASSSGDGLFLRQEPGPRRRGCLPDRCRLSRSQR